MQMGMGNPMMVGAMPTNGATGSAGAMPMGGTAMQMGGAAMPMGGAAMPMGMAMNPMQMMMTPAVPMMGGFGAMPCAFGCFGGMVAAMPMGCAGMCSGSCGSTTAASGATSAQGNSSSFGSPHMASPPASMPLPASAQPSGTTSSSSAGKADSGAGAGDEDDKDGLGTMSSEQRAVVVRALKEIAAKESEKKKAAEKKAEAAAAEEKNKIDPEEQYDKIPRCFLHKKPNAKCKKCQQVLIQTMAREEEKAAHEKDAREEKGGEQKGDAASEVTSERKTFNCSPMLKEQILKSSYFKSLLEITSLDGLIQEIPQYADTLDVYNGGTAMGGSKTTPSCFICLVYRLFTLKNIFEDELNEFINHDLPIVRCVGFVYLRFVTPPNQLLEVLEDYLYDDMELAGGQDGDSTQTIGEFVESLLIREKYFDTPVPRIPVKARQAIEEKIAPMPQYRKRMQANRRVFKPNNVDGMEVEVSIDGEWRPGKALEVVGKVASREKLRVALESGSEVKVPLGKVVLRSPTSSSDSESDDDRGGGGGGGGGYKKRHNRSRSRRRGRSPDWSRHKGKSDAEMLQELRERARDGAVCGSGKQYARRPLTIDASMASTAFTDPSGEGKYESADRRRASSQEEAELAKAAARRRSQEEDDRQRRMHDIFTKYCAPASNYSSNSAASGNKNEIERPDVLRLG